MAQIKSDEKASRDSRESERTGSQSYCALPCPDCKHGKMYPAYDSDGHRTFTCNSCGYYED